VMGNDGRVCGRRCSYLVHARSIAPNPDGSVDGVSY
jgi:hypothetical protein